MPSRVSAARSSRSTPAPVTWTILSAAPSNSSGRKLRPDRRESPAHRLISSVPQPSHRPARDRPPEGSAARPHRRGVKSASGRRQSTRFDMEIFQKLLNSVVPAETSGSAKKHSSTSGSIPVLRVICFSFGGMSTMSPGLIGISPLSATVVPDALEHVDALLETVMQMRPARRIADLRHRKLGDAERHPRSDRAGHRLERRAPRQAEFLRLGLLEKPRHRSVPSPLAAVA